MAKRASSACKSVWARRTPRWFAGLGVALVVIVALGVTGASSVFAGASCTPDAPVNTALPAMTPTGYGSYGTSLSTEHHRVMDARLFDVGRADL